MTVATVATSQTKKLVKLGLSLFRRGFNAPKCKTAAKMAVARIKLLRNKREVVVKQMRRDIALLLQSGQDATARIRVEHVMREQNVLAANEFIELFCELIVSRLSIIAKRRECPADLKEGIASLIFASPRCSEIPELVALREVFEKKYGKDFVSAATDLRPNCGVNRMLIDKLSVRTPTGEQKLKIMKEIAKEHQVEWDTADTEKELLKPPEEIIEGPRTFVSATTLPAAPMLNQSVQLNKSTPMNFSCPMNTGGGDDDNMQFKDASSAAIAAARSANEAIAAAKAAAYHATKDLNRSASQPPSFGNNMLNTSSESNGFESISGQPINPRHMNQQYNNTSGRTSESQSFNDTHYSPPNVATMTDNSSRNNCNSMESERKMQRRHSYNAPSGHSGIKFDESDCDDEDDDYDEEINADTPPRGTGFLPPQRPPPGVPPSQVTKQTSFSHSVHPKLPDYDTLAARFEALKNHRNSLP